MCVSVLLVRFSVTCKTASVRTHKTSRYEFYERNNRKYLTAQPMRQNVGYPLVRSIATVANAIVDHARRDEVPRFPIQKRTLLMRAVKDAVGASVRPGLVRSVETVAVIIVDPQEAYTFPAFYAAEHFLVVRSVEVRLYEMGASYQIVLLENCHQLVKER